MIKFSAGIRLVLIALVSLLVKCILKCLFLVIINAGLLSSRMVRWLAFLSTEKIKLFGHLLQPEVFRVSQGSRLFERQPCSLNMLIMCGVHVLIE